MIVSEISLLKERRRLFRIRRGGGGSRESSWASHQPYTTIFSVLSLFGAEQIMRGCPFGRRTKDIPGPGKQTIIKSVGVGGRRRREARPAFGVGSLLGFLGAAGGLFCSID